MKLIRVKYGKKNTPKEDREYQIDGFGPVGTIKEYKEMFPAETLKIIDKISGGEKNDPRIKRQ